MISIQNYSKGSPIPFKHLTFPGGEEHVTIDGEAIETPTVVITANIWASQDVMTLLMVTDALRRLRVAEILLVLKYVPYARQDRVANPGEALSIKVMCDLINSQKYDDVEIWDPHSEVTTALLERATVNPQGELFESTIVKGSYFGAGHSVLVSPDAGAMKKAYEIASRRHLDLVTATKHRDTQTGQITGTTVDSAHIGKRDFWIVDDICDGGRTFTELAKVLRPLTDGRINLYVTHGIFSKGFTPFVGLIDEIHCPNVHPNHANVDLTGPVKLNFPFNK